MEKQTDYPRFAERGRAYVYVLPCRDEDLLKVGFSRDPLERFRTLHSRFFEFFDLDRGLLIETDYVRDARRVERLFITTFQEQQAQAPLVVPRSAAGHTEWYRGVDAAVNALASNRCAKEGYAMHAPLRPWLRQRLETWSDRLFQWSAEMFRSVEYEYFNRVHEGQMRTIEKALRATLDTYVALGIDIRPLVPSIVAMWYLDAHFFERRG